MGAAGMPLPEGFVLPSVDLGSPSTPDPTPDLPGVPDGPEWRRFGALTEFQRDALRGAFRTAHERAILADARRRREADPMGLSAHPKATDWGRNADDGGHYFRACADRLRLRGETPAIALLVDPGEGDKGVSRLFPLVEGIALLIGPTEESPEGKFYARLEAEEKARQAERERELADARHYAEREQSAALRAAEQQLWASLPRDARIYARAERLVADRGIQDLSLVQLLDLLMRVAANEPDTVPAGTPPPFALLPPLAEPGMPSPRLSLEGFALDRLLGRQQRTTTNEDR